MYTVLYRLEEALLENGESPFAQWFESLSAPAAARVRVSLIRLSQGNMSRVEWFRGIGECKIEWGPGLRVYLAKSGDDILLLLGGGSKKGQQRDMDRAVQIWADFKKRKAAELEENHHAADA